jgi:putative membrane protein
MKNILIKLLISTIAVLITAYLLPGVRDLDFFSALLVASVLAFLNAFLKPILVVLTIPITIFSLGLFLLVINASIILVASQLLKHFEVSNFWWALLFSLILSFITSILENLLGNNNRPQIES